MGEFDLIKRYFQRENSTAHNGVILSIGDDCALTQLSPEQQLAVTTDTLVCGTHFLPTISPEDLAYKSVAVNLSDLAAMGATPRWVSLALTLPEVDHCWLQAFSRSLFDILDRYNVSLIGGDTTKGSLSITLTAQGALPQGQGLFRHQADIGDWIFVSGCLGDSAAGLALLLNPLHLPFNASQAYCVERHLRPTPRVELGQMLRAFSRCAIDISDGLLADLGHILKRSRCGAQLYLENLPLSEPLRANYSLAQAEKWALTGGEDYELCFTVAEQYRDEMEKTAQALGLSCHCIGRIVPLEQGLTLWREGQECPLPTHIGFDHFK
ncbi:thiamine monophosphate kinase [[Actinobacillus] muris]|uniref:Thiamine-monophosphate kinase n=1 Tax=Muribacter muris TaxID=67855 RepID=A0A0J5PA35_9PAST|nr:thiamine-phosphate kinase [Muribacter muris]KMK52414.1 thiamine monophosphate kinase [[Actinobacillus] muris] [Muribacter muris]